MSIIPRQVQYGKRCLVYCGDNRCDCDRGPLGRRGPLDDWLPEVVPDSAARSPVRGAPGNFHHGWDFHNGLPEDGSPRELYVVSFLASRVVFRTMLNDRSLVHASSVDSSPSVYGPDSHFRICHRLRVRRRWLPIDRMPAGYVARLGCDRYPDHQVYGHSREIKQGQVFVQTHADTPRDWRATHYDRTSLSEYTSEFPATPETRVPPEFDPVVALYGGGTGDRPRGPLPHASERRVPRLPAPRPVRHPED